jgi:DNA-directed RNA polymerase subunit H (RpoH/RPB5)
MGEQTNFLMPIHRKLNSGEVIALLEKYSLSGVDKLPKIKVKDPAIATIETVVGDVIEITRSSFAGESKYYRVIVE